ncbi:hypothetical protein HK096_008985, partial [Nowakowskiella sp. JEL0078]
QQQQFALTQQQQFSGIHQEDLLGYLRETQYKNQQRLGTAAQDLTNFRDPAIMMAKMAASNASGIGPAPGFESRQRLRGFDISTSGTTQQDWVSGTAPGNFTTN